jgi:hypothetical protein
MSQASHSMLFSYTPSERYLPGTGNDIDLSTTGVLCKSIDRLSASGKIITQAIPEASFVRTSKVRPAGYKCGNENCQKVHWSRFTEILDDEKNVIAKFCSNACLHQFCNPDAHREDSTENPAQAPS